jgi:HEAT repeat protein
LEDPPQQRAAAWEAEYQTRLKEYLGKLKAQSEINAARLIEPAVTTQSTMDLAVRQTAIQELGRTFGAGALGVLEQLLSDPNEAIRQNVVTALARVHSDQAVALLQRTAASDSSAQVRAKAQATLSVAPVQ